MNKALRLKCGFTYDEAACLTLYCRELAEHLLECGTADEIAAAREMLHESYL